MKKLCLASSLLLAGALPALAQNVIAENPAQMADILRSFGYRAELTTDTGGDPKIASSSGGANFSIFFYGCTNSQNCDAISFSAAFDLDPGSNTKLMNDWNQKKRYSKAYLDDEQDPVIDMDVFLGSGGVSIDNFRFWVDTWERALGDFKTHIDF
jgi:Putative bacterial sensory transduction regulator